jgi:hypothetical protein
MTNGNTDIKRLTAALVWFVVATPLAIWKLIDLLVWAFT